MSQSLPESSKRFSTTAEAAENRNFKAATARSVDFWVVRTLFVVCTALLWAAWAPFGLRTLTAAGAGFLMAMIVLIAELRLRRVEISGLVGGALGLLIGVSVALLAAILVSRTVEPEPTKSFLELGCLFALGYLGLSVGAQTGKKFPMNKLVSVLHRETANSEQTTGKKLLDTSVLIDGRIADICEANFLDGPLLVPQFVLRELQQVADSSDTLRRQRGRRGLEVLQRMQKLPNLSVQVLEGDSTPAGDVDHKLVDLARQLNAKIVTNDFNLNKVASVQGISILNVNLLANALRPAVLPGEPMRVFILREGKEANQGVAYLEDGTMVVVDGARRLLNRNVDILVTSVHQTPAGKMIFGRLDDRPDANPPLPRQATPGRSEPSERISN